MENNPFMFQATNQYESTGDNRITDDNRGILLLDDAVKNLKDFTITGRFARLIRWSNVYRGYLIGAKRREWMGIGVAGIMTMIDS